VQVATINRTFTPDAASVAWARKVIAAFAADPAAGVVGLDGKMLDRPHLRAAERVLARAAASPTPA
jgi:citrate lyase subunit beta / citryl-CoA lyase